MPKVTIAQALKYLDFEGTRLQVNALQGSYKPGAMYCVNNVTSVPSLGVSKFYSHATDRFTLSSEGFFTSSSVNTGIEAFTARFDYTTGRITYLLDTIRNNEVDGYQSVQIFPFNKPNITNCKVSGGSTVDYTHPTGMVDGCTFKNGSNVHVRTMSISACTFDDSDIDFLSVTGTCMSTQFISQNSQALSNCPINFVRSVIKNCILNVNDSVGFTLADSEINTLTISNAFGGDITINASDITQNCFFDMAGATLLVSASTMKGSTDISDFAGGGTIQVVSSYFDSIGHLFQNNTGLTIVNGTTVLGSSVVENNTTGQLLVYGCYIAAQSTMKLVGSGPVAGNIQYCSATGGGVVQNSLGASGPLGANTIYFSSVDSNGRIIKNGTGIVDSVKVSGNSIITLTMNPGSTFRQSTFDAKYTGNFTTTGINQYLYGYAQTYTSALSGVTGTGNRNF